MQRHLVAILFLLLSVLTLWRFRDAPRQQNREPLPTNEVRSDEVYV